MQETQKQINHKFSFILFLQGNSNFIDILF